MTIIYELQCLYCHRSGIRLRQCVCGALLCQVCQQNHSTWTDAEQS